MAMSEDRLLPRDPYLRRHGDAYSDYSEQRSRASDYRARDAEGAYRRAEDVASLHGADVMMMEKETHGRSLHTQRDEIIATLMRKTEESSELCAKLEGRLVEAEREIDDLRAENEHLRREAAVGPPGLEQELVERGRHIDALEAELRDKERTNQLMNEMLGERTSKEEVLKQQHEARLAEQTRELEDLVAERAREVDRLQTLAQQTRLDVCAIFSIAPQDTTEALLDSMETIKLYIDRRDADIAALEDELRKARDEAELGLARSADEEMQTLRKALQDAKAKEHDLRAEHARLLEEEAAARSSAEAELQAARDEAARLRTDRQGADSGDAARVGAALAEARGGVEAEGVVVPHRDDLAGQVRELAAVARRLAQENAALVRSRDRSRRQKEEVNCVVLDDPDLAAMVWDSDDSADHDDLSEHPSGNLRWAQTRVRVRTVIDRLLRSDRDAARYKQKYQDLKHAAPAAGAAAAKFDTPSKRSASASAATHATGPYLGLITEALRAADDVGPGVRLLDVKKATAAERAGLQCGDRVLEFNDEPLACPYDLEQCLARTHPGDTLDVTFLRGELICDTQLVVDFEREKRRRRRRKMDRSEIQARVRTASRSPPPPSKARKERTMAV
eukprot:TRINITY_DN9499_c0_g1_i2.p1 TRINITY_DN9499_c0_g1~~TRINITY_DN9499_c0_g1_i2.p1  ORF type:complete len:621 (+),score=268.86 TRINITY_DN9499_c0_g1_i2:93-1955(+)